MIYLDNASTTYPKPDNVYKVMDKFLKDEGVSPGRGGYKSAMHAGYLVMEARVRISKFFGGDKPERLIFTLNATDALNLAIKGALKEGDNVVTSLLEHNSVMRPLRRLEATKSITVTQVDNSPDGFVYPDDVKKAINNKTKLVTITHASNVLGTIQPIAEIGKMIKEVNDKILFLVDCAQTAGVLPIDINESCIDLLAFPGHKALFGPPGTGGLYIKDGIELTPWREGGTGVDSISPTQPTDMPFWLEAGTPNTVGIIGLKEGIAFIIDNKDAIWKHEIKLLDRFIQQIKDDKRFEIYGSKDANKHVGCISINIKGIKPEEVGTRLDELANTAVRAGLHCAPYIHRKIGSFPEGTVRFSPGFFNTIEEIDTAVGALHKIAEAGPGKIEVPPSSTR